MLKVIRHYNPPPGSASTRSSDAIECSRCKTITWVWADEEHAHCKGCRLTFYHCGPSWLDRAEHLAKKKAATPEES